MFVGERLRSLRKESGKSQSDVANLTGITQGAITNYECGRRIPDRETLLKFCELFGVQEAYFFDDVEVDKVRQLIDDLRIRGIIKSAEDVQGDVAELLLDTIRADIRMNNIKRRQGI